MSDDIKGVFVRLPLSDEQMRLVKLSYSGSMNSDEAFVKSLHAIGTPVTGGELPVIATLGTLRDPVPCVSQSDALAKLAEKDAEIARYRLALHQIVEAQDRKNEPTYDVLRDCIHFADIALKGPEA